jgi:hypothetical protein
MSLERHLRVLWRQRLVLAVGLVLAVALAFLAAFQVSSDGVKRRGTEVWSSTSQVFVTQRGFPWGRVTLPAAAVPGDPTASSTGTAPSGDSGDHIQYADPTRFVNLALLYSVISHSDQVRARLKERPSPDQIQTTILDPTNRGQSYLPIITLTTQAATPAGAVSLNAHTVEGLRDLLSSEQRANGISGPNRVLLSVMNKASAPMLVQGRSMTSSILAFLLAIIGAIALAHIVEGLAMARDRRTPFFEMPDVDGSAPFAAEGISTNGHHSDPVVVAPTGPQQRP